MKFPERELPDSLRPAFAKADMAVADPSYFAWLQAQAAQENAHPEYALAVRLAEQQMAMREAGETTLSERLTAEWQQSPWRDDASWVDMIEGKTARERCDLNYFLEILLGGGPINSG